MHRSFVVVVIKKYHHNPLMPCHSLSGQDTQGKLHFTRSYRRSSSNAVKNGFPIKLKPKTSFDISGNNGSNFICQKQLQFSSLRKTF